MLTDFSALTLDELTAEIEAMLGKHHAPRLNYAARTLSTLTPTPESPPVVLSPKAVGVSTSHSTEYVL